MSLIESFSKPRWQHSSPDVRKGAIAELDDQAVLVELVKTDPEKELRALALSRVTSPDLLDELIESLQQDLQTQARKQRLNQLLPDEAGLKAIDSDDTLVTIASLASNPELVSSALNLLKSPDVRRQVASEHPQAKMRLVAAKGIDDLEILQELMQHSKNRDKAVYRHCKEQLDQHQQSIQAKAELQTRIKKLVEKADELEEIADAIEFKGQYLLIRQVWPELQDHASKEQAQHIRAALDLGESRQKAISDADAARQEKVALTESSQQQFTILLAELEDLDHSTLDHTNKEQIALINTNLNEIEERWVAALRNAKASAEQTARCKSLLNEWRGMLLTEQRLQEKGAKLKKIEAEAEKADHSDFLTLQRQLKETKKLINSFVWPESHISIMPEPIKRLHGQKEVIEAKLDELKKQEKQNLQRLETAFEKLREELKTNHFDNADREYRRLRNILRRLSPDKQNHHQQELRPLVARLNEIHDWQGFAIEPKKLDLIQRMQALIDTGEDPDVLARKIKTLQTEWKQLGHLAPHRDQELWREFKAASDQAYEPCKAAFAERAVFYQQNVDRRMELVAQLVEYEKKMHWPDAAEPGEDHQKPDWKLVQKTLDTARQAFRNIKPVDRKGERKTQKKLKVVCDRIYNHIKSEYERNIVLKEQMIESARGFAEMEDLEMAISNAKKIQREWKEVGMTPMRVDRKLWKKFRSACDAVFARLDAKREESRQAMSGQITQAEELLKQGRALLDSKDEEQRSHLKKELTHLHATLRSIELPVRIRQQMNKRFGDLEREARDQVDALRRQKEQLGWNQLTQNLKACSLKGEDEKQALALWVEENETTKGIDSALLNAFWEQGTGNTPDEELREACIALEILFEKDSPPEDKQARMAYQMKRLVAGMGGQQTTDRDQALLDHINQFMKLRPSGEWVERFCATVESIKGTSKV